MPKRVESLRRGGHGGLGEAVEDSGHCLMVGTLILTGRKVEIVVHVEDRK
jgi:hypothetical protein